MRSKSPKPSRAEVTAEKVYAWLQALDPKDPAAERAELAAANVPAHRIYTLYPTDFSAIFPGLEAHLRAVDVHSLLKQQQALLKERRALVKLAAEAGSMKRRSGSTQSAAEIEVERLAQVLFENLGGAAAEGANTVAATCAVMLWHIYALIPQRHSLTEAQRGQLTSSACWFGIYLLKLEL